jgi:integrase
MPRLTHLHPSYRLHKKSGQAIVTLSGKDFYLGPYGSEESRTEYDQLLAEWLANGRCWPQEPASEPEAPYSIIRLCAEYLDFAEVYYRKDGQQTTSLFRVKVTLRIMATSYGREPASDFGPLKLRAIQQSLIDAKKSRKYINYISEQVKRIFKWGVSMERLPPAVYQALATVPGLKKGRSNASEPTPVEPVPDKTIELTLPHLSSVVADMVRFQRLTACRPGEACIVRPCDVDMSMPVWRYVPHSHKTEHHGKRRTILIGAKAQGVLRPYMLRAANSYCFSPEQAVNALHRSRGEKRKTPLAQGNRPGTNRKSSPERKAGDRYNSGSYALAISRACEIAFGMPAELRRIANKLSDAEKQRRRNLAREWRAKNCWTPNQLRHTAATEIRSLHGVEAAQVILGHAHLNVTEVYAERDLDKAAVIMAKLG